MIQNYILLIVIATAPMMASGAANRVVAVLSNLSPKPGAVALGFAGIRSPVGMLLLGGSLGSSGFVSDLESGLVELPESVVFPWQCTTDANRMSARTG